MSAPVVDRPSELVAQLLLQLEQLPPARAAALRVVQCIDNPRSTASDVALAASVDPALTARMLRMANSAYYGLSGRVSTASFAVTVIGFATVRSLAAMSAAGFVGDRDLPPGFWARGATVAAGAALVARRVGADASESFCVGILHDLGNALLWRHDSERQAALLAAATPEEPVQVLEQRAYGATHASLCSDVLTAWHFPAEICATIARHHDAPSPAAPALRRALQGGLALAALTDGAGPVDARALDAAHVPDKDRSALVAQVRVHGAELASALMS